MNIPWIFKRYEDYPDSFSSSLFSTSINKLITNLYHNIYIRIFGKRIIDPSRFQYPFQIFSRVPLLKKFIFQHVYSPFTRSMNPSARSIKRYSSKITIHRLENSVIRLSNYQSFPPRLCENISLKIPENNRRSRGSHPRADLSPSRMPGFERRENRGEGSERVSKLFRRRWRGGGRGCSSTNWTPAAWQYNYGLLPRPFRGFFSPREEHAIPSASIGRVKNYHPALLPLLPFRRSEGDWN